MKKHWLLKGIDFFVTAAFLFCIGIMVAVSLSNFAALKRLEEKLDEFECEETETENGDVKKPADSATAAK